MAIQVYRFRRIYVKFLTFVFAIAVCVLGSSVLSGESPDLIVGDGNGYYAWVRSIVIDGDLDFENDFRELYFPEPSPADILTKTPKNLVPNKYPIGVAILEAPGFLLGHLIAKATPFEADGISPPYQLTVTISIVLLILSSFYLFYIALIDYGVNNKVACLFAAMPLIGTNLLHYLAKEPGMAHGAGVALTNILIYMSIINLQSRFKKFIFIFIAGIFMGWLIIIRNTNLILMPFFIWLFHKKIKKKNNIFILIIGAGLMIFLQQLSFFLLWGRPVLNSYGYERFTLELKNIFSAVLGTDYGLFLYHPWYLILVILNLLGCLGLKNQRILNLTVITSFIMLWLINGFWGEDFGDSFGHRAFIETLTPLSFGAAITVENISDSFYRYIRLPALMLAGILIVCNIYLWGGYLLQKYPHNSERTIEQAYTWIIR